MSSYEEIREQIKNLDGVSELLGRKEIKELPNILWEDEKIERIVQGLYENGMGILVATNKRLIFVDKGLLYGLRVEDFPYDKITSIRYQTGLFLGEITIFASGNKANIEQVYKKQARGFCEYVRARISSVKEHASFPTNQKAEKEGLISKLEQLAKLKEQGILSDEEFQKAKKKLLE